MTSCNEKDKIDTIINFWPFFTLVLFKIDNIREIAAYILVNW